jgi:hypothetical protein
VSGPPRPQSRWAPGPERARIFLTLVGWDAIRPLRLKAEAATLRWAFGSDSYEVTVDRRGRPQVDAARADPGG